MTTLPRALLGIGLCLLVGACDDDDAPSDDDQPDATAPDASTPDGGAKDASIDATVDASLDADIDAKVDSGRSDAGFCPSERYSDGGAAYQEFTVELTTAAESPVCTAAGPAAAGSATVVFSCIESSFYVTGLRWQNLSSTVQAAHIHYGAAGSSGPVVINLEPNGNSGNGAGNASTYQAKAGVPATFDAFLDDLRAGKAYINVHTESCPGGEIRGQILTQ